MCFIKKNCKIILIIDLRESNFMEKGIFKTLERESSSAADVNLLWLWQNQPPVMQWWFALSGISIMAVYFVLLSSL